MKNYIITGLIIGILSISLLAYKQANQIKSMRLEAALLVAKQETKLREIEKENYNEVIKAIDEATKRTTQIEIDSTAVNNANDRLQHTISKLNSEISNLSESARIDYTTTLSELFEECTIEYTKVARQADRHINDLRTYKGIFESIKFDE